MPRGGGRAPWLGLAAAGVVLSAASAALAAPQAESPETGAQPAAALAQPAPPAPPTAGADVGDVGQTAYDPWEGFNRGMFAVGMGLDRAVIGPIAHGYMRVTPQPVQNRVSNFVYNLGEPSTALEDVLQGHPKRAGRTTARFVINTSIGVLGLFDVASKMGVRGHESDFGQTLGRYGAQPGPYLYVPAAGPLNLRDGVGRVVDIVTDPVGFVTGPITSTPGAARFGVTVLDQRATGDPAFRALHDATDPYVTTRSAYSQHRASVVQAATGDAAALPDFEP